MLPPQSFFFFFFPFSIKQVGNLNNLIVSPEQTHVALRSIQKMPFSQGIQPKPSPKCCLYQQDPENPQARIPAPGYSQGGMWWGTPPAELKEILLCAYGSVLCFLSSAMARFLQLFTRMLRAPVL